MSGTFLAIVLSCAAAAEEKQTIDLNGAWTGTYEYPKDDQRVSVTFKMTLAQDGATITGNISEPNTFGDPNVAMLKATLKGTYDAAAGQIKFIKTYDGTGGVDHDVEYKGQLSRNGRRLEGTWDIEGYSGTFKAEKSKK